APSRLPARGGLGEAARAGPQDAAETVTELLAQRRGERPGVELAVRRDQAYLELAGAPPFAHHEVAQPRATVGPRPGALAPLLLAAAAPHPRALPCGEALLLAPAKRDAPGEVSTLGGQQAVLDRRDPVTTGRRVKAAYEL